MPPSRSRAVMATLAMMVTAGGTAAEVAAASGARAVVSASAAQAKGCHTHFAGKTKRTAVVRARASASGLVRARLSARGDWDLGVFDAKTRRYVAGSASFGGREVAEGFVHKGQRLLVQACRFKGRASKARVAVRFVASKAGPAGTTQIVTVSTPSSAASTFAFKGTTAPRR